LVLPVIAGIIGDEGFLKTKEGVIQGAGLHHILDFENSTEVLTSRKNVFLRPVIQKIIRLKNYSESPIYFL
jgi:hypothetical protein